MTNTELLRRHWGPFATKDQAQDIAIALDNEIIFSWHTRCSYRRILKRKVAQGNMVANYNRWAYELKVVLLVLLSIRRQGRGPMGFH